MGRMRRTRALVCAVAAVAATALPAGAQEDTTSSTVPDEPTTSSSTATTAAPVGELDTDTGAAEADAGFQETDGIVGRGPYAGQPPFDPVAANAVYEADLVAARGRLAAAEAAIATSQRALAGAEGHLAELQASLQPLRDQEQAAVLGVLASHDDFKKAAVDAYIRGSGGDTTLALAVGDANDMSVAREYAEVALADDRKAIDGYIAQKDALTAELDRVATDLVAAQGEIDRRRAEVDAALRDRVNSSFEVEVWSQGSHVFVPGYTFPIAGPVKFGNSFGAPRMLGTEYEHWHEGCDVFAEYGTPLVAAEDGVLARVKSGGVLGGNSLRIVGASGYTHYYAHLSGFAEGVADGVAVKAGDLVGFVGDTGNAAGTSPHLHYEILLPDDTSMNPYAVLAVSHSWRELATEPFVPGTIGADPPPPPGQ